MAQPATGVTTRDIVLSDLSGMRTIPEGTKVQIGAPALKMDLNMIYLGLPDGPINVHTERTAVKIIADCPGTDYPRQVRKLSHDLGSKFGGRVVAVCACGAERTVKNNRLYRHATV